MTSRSFFELLKAAELGAPDSDVHVLCFESKVESDAHMLMQGVTGPSGPTGPKGDKGDKD